MPSLFVLGYPGDVGGANTECWHTLRLWRQFGVDVTLLPTWSATADWRRRAEAIGCRTVECQPESLHGVERLAGSTVVAFCNSQFLRHAFRLQEMGCRTVWVGCMTWMFVEERRHYARRKPFDAYVFQSRYQLEKLQPQLARFGVRPEQCHLIRGAFCWDEFPFRPKQRQPGEPLVVGRISRAALDKFSARTWPIYGRIAPPMRARVMGWSDEVQQKVGTPPAWAECLPPGSETPQEFLASLDVLMPINGGAAENWPRAGLEAMACGVPVVAPNQWGWQEMIRHGETGLLADSEEEFSDHANRLAADETLRGRIARQARDVLCDELAHPGKIRAGWEKMLERLA